MDSDTLVVTRTGLRFLCAFLLILLGLAAAPVHAQDPDVKENVKENGKPAKPDAQVLREPANPGPEHDLLEKFPGKWRVKVEKGRGGRSIPSDGNGYSNMMMERRFLWLGYGSGGEGGKFKAMEFVFERKE